MSWFSNGRCQLNQNLKEHILVVTSNGMINRYLIYRHILFLVKFLYKLSSLCYAELCSVMCMYDV